MIVLPKGRRAKNFGGGVISCALYEKEYKLMCRFARIALMGIVPSSSECI